MRVARIEHFGLSECEEPLMVTEVIYVNYDIQVIYVSRAKAMSVHLLLVVDMKGRHRMRSSNARM